MLVEYILVFLGAATPWIEIALVIPAGIIRGLSPFWVMSLAFIGNIITVIPVIIGYEKVKRWLQSRREKKGRQSSNRQERGKKIWDKYGLPGLALLGPILTGIHIAAFLSMVLGAKKSRALFWMTFSLLIWTVIFGVITAMGYNFFVH